MVSGEILFQRTARLWPALSSLLSLIFPQRLWVIAHQGVCSSEYSFFLTVLPRGLLLEAAIGQQENRRCLEISSKA